MARTIPIFAQNSRLTAANLEFRVSPPLALYVHVPWCVRKCPYCDFNSHEAHGTIPEREYVDALIADLQSALPLIWGRPVVSVFFGGGTPSLLSPAAIDELITAFRALAMLSPDAEITAQDLVVDGFETRFTAVRAGEALGTVRIGMPGRHVAQTARLLGATGRVGLRVEEHQHPRTAQPCEIDRLAALIRQGKRWCD